MDKKYGLGSSKVAIEIHKKSRDKMLLLRQS